MLDRTVTGARSKNNDSRDFFLRALKPSVTIRYVMETRMPDLLIDLENRRASVQMRIAQLGDMRSGSITGTGGRCGNPNCHCHRPDDPGHGPYYRLTRKVKGKTVTETLSSAAGLAKARREVAQCRRFRELSEQLLDVSERICELRPVTETAPSAQENKRPKRSKKNSLAN